MFASEKLIDEHIYTRNMLQEMFAITDATLRNGVFRLAAYQSIWLFVTEQKTSDIPQLHDLLDGDRLEWDGQPEGRTDKYIIEHEAAGWELLVFYRKHKNEFPRAGFRYKGRFRYQSHTGSRPTHFILLRVNGIAEIVSRDLAAFTLEESPGAYYTEGKALTRLVNTHERNPRLRTEAVRIHGTRCQVCDFSFAEFYGSQGEGFVEIHHLRPVAAYEGEVMVDPAHDMAALCSNCHRMIHRNPDHPLSIEELRAIVRMNRNRSLVNTFTDFS
jgi:5-methylcytosine-specific restriction protein A